MYGENKNRYFEFKNLVGRQAPLSKLELLGWYKLDVLDVRLTDSGRLLFYAVNFSRPYLVENAFTQALRYIVFVNKVSKSFSFV